MGLDSYAKQVNKFALLKKADELELARRWLKGDRRAGDLLINSNLRFAFKMAHEFARRFNQPLEDLVQVANEGLLRARVTFDPKRGYRFCTFAVHWIRAKLTLYCVHNVSMVKYGTRNVERLLFSNLRYLHAELHHTFPQDDDSKIYERLGEHLDLDPEELRTIHQRLAGDYSLNAPVHNGQRSAGGDRPLEWQETLEDKEPLADEKISAQESRERVRKIVTRCAHAPRHLHETEVRRDIRTKREIREKFVIEKRLLNSEPLTLDAIADAREIKSTNGGKKLSRESVRQIESSVMKRLRGAL